MRWWESQSTETIDVAPTDPNCCVGCDHFLGAYAYVARATNATYSVAATEIDVMYLVDGDSPRAGRLGEAGSLLLLQL